MMQPEQDQCTEQRAITFELGKIIGNIVLGSDKADVVDFAMAERFTCSLDVQHKASFRGASEARQCVE